MRITLTRVVRSRSARATAFVAAFGLVLATLTLPAFASTRPSVTGLSTHFGAYFGGARITVRGSDFDDVQAVMFGSKCGYSLDVLSSRKLTVDVPGHSYDRVHVKVITLGGTSPLSAANAFTYTHANLDSPIWGGLTARQEQHISAQVRAAHHGVHSARAARRWTPAMGVTAVRRAASWLGLPYSWAGGNTRGPSTGVCAHNGGDMDCHVIGFDCSGLALYSWAPYETLIHSAATQHHQAGHFHPSIGQLMPGDLVFFSGYIADGIGHVAVYTGHGMVVEAAESGTTIRRSRLVDVIAGSGVYRGATRPMTTGREGAVPHLSSVTAQVPATGGLVTLTGTNLRGATSVSVGGQYVYSFVHHSATRLVVRVPAHTAGHPTIAVANAWGTATRTLTYVAPPRITSLSPSSGSVTGANIVTVVGTGLSTVTSVTVGTKAVALRAVSGRRLTLTMPAHAAGPVAVVVRSAFGSSNSLSYTYVAPTPTPTPTVTPTTSAPVRRH